VVRRWWIGVVLALSAPPAFADDTKAPPRDRLVDMVVAEVGGTVVTLSELVAETRLVLLRTRGPDVAWSAELSPRLLGAVLRNVVHRNLLLAEVKRLQLRDPDPEDVDRAGVALRRAFATSGDFDRFLERAGFRDAGSEVRALPPLLVAILKAELLAERFLDVRVRLDLDVPDDEVEACYEKNVARLGGRPLEKVRARIVDRLRYEKERAGYEALIVRLEGRTEVVYIPPFERTPLPPDDDTVGLRCTTP
jgi:hypothetical protein